MLCNCTFIHINFVFFGYFGGLKGNEVYDLSHAQVCPSANFGLALKSNHSVNMLLCLWLGTGASSTPDEKNMIADIIYSKLTMVIYQDAAI